ncbi:MAG TPA: type II secretion system F family protein [Microvirga sp.]|jgi:tight adherence protein C
MELLTSLLETLGEDGGLLLALLAISGLGLVGLGTASAVQGRSDIRRRTSEGLADGPAPQRAAGRVEAGHSLHRLATYLESTFSGGDPLENRLIRLQLVQAGFFDQRAVALYFAFRLGAALALGLGALVAVPLLNPEITTTSLSLAVTACSIMGYFAPKIYVSRRITRRATEHRIGFPDFMDLMVVCSEAGLSMEAAIERIARELVDGYPSLAENLYMVSLEIRAGKSFTEALERMGERLGIEEAAMLATLLQQSAELGTSLAQSLRVYSEEMRNKRMARAEEKAYALPAKLVIPLTVFVFPVLIVTLMYPAVARVLSQLGKI